MKRLLLFLFILILKLTTYNLQLTYAATATLEHVEKTFMEGRYEKSAEDAKELIDARSYRRDELYYLKGLCELKLNRFKEARESFEKIISTYASSKRVFDAHVGIGDSFFLEGNTDEAAKRYNDTLKKFPADRNIAVVRSRLNNCSKPLPQSMTPAEKEPAGNFSVQAGSFKSKKNANRLSAKLSSEGYGSRVEISTDSGETFYRVRIGRYKSKRSAEDAAGVLRRAGYSTKVSADDTCL